MVPRPLKIFLLVLLPALVAAKEGKGCKRCGDAPDSDTDVAVPDDLPKPEDPLTIVSIEPSTVRANAEQSALIYGSAFQDGAKVTIGAASITPALRDANALRVKVPGMLEGTYDVVVTNPDGKQATLRRGYVVRSEVADCRFLTVTFAFDKSELDAASTAAIDKILGCYKQAQSIVVSGHADERGTTEYNLALAERRAEAVQRYLTTAGVLPKVVRTVSWGEERPVAKGHDERSWAMNRRAEIDASE